MKSKYSLIVGSSLLLCASILTVGCSSGGGSGGGGSGGSAGISSATTSVSGTTGTGSGTTKTSSLGILKAAVAEPTATVDSLAALVVDKDANGLLDDTDFVYSAPIMSDGSFSFDSVVVDETKPTLAQLTLSKKGYAPVVRTLSLTKDNALSIYADIAAKPVLTEVVDISSLSKTDRANTFVKFGVSTENGSLSSFSKMMTLSELQAEAVGLGEGTLSTTTIPLAAFNADVKSITANMQAFDSTKAKDLSLFPGKFSGHGYSASAIGVRATSDTEEVALESAAFDLMDLRDQNGNPIDLNISATPSSKFGATADAASCPGLYWQRHVTDAQASVIEAWGDDDNDSTNGFQVPIWSNDNSTGSWQFVGEADWDSNTNSFSICVDQKWQGYLNCDSPINVGTAPKELCIDVADQLGNVMNGGLNFRAQQGNSFSNGYLGSDGKAVVDLATGTPSDWNVSYSGAITGWSDVGIDTSGYTVSSTVGCDYDLNVTVDNPYNAQVYVFAVDEQNVSIPNALVTLRSNDYTDYYRKSLYTNTKGYALFDVKPNVTYTAEYIAGSAKVDVDGSVVSPETADSGKYASVIVKDENVAPTVYLYTKDTITNVAEVLPFEISASDKNGDTLTLQSFTLNGTPLVEGKDYTVKYSNTYGGYYYLRGVLDLNSTTVSGISPTSLAAGDYALAASVSDGKLSTNQTRNITVAQNHAPVPGVPYLYSGYNYYYASSTSIPVGDYYINAYSYDIDGDAITQTITVDGNTYDDTPVSFTTGEHNVSVSVSDGNLNASRSTVFYIGNHAPVIKSAGATSYLIDIKQGQTFKLYAYVTDADRDELNVTAVDDANNTYQLSRVGSYGSKYISQNITLTQAKAMNSFRIVANDGESNSTVSVVNVESIAANQPPHFTKELTDAQINVNTQKVFECEASDPEGTFVTYSWSLDENVLSETGTTYTQTFTTTGQHIISCTATDGDGKTATSSATILVVDPSVSGTLTVHAKYEGLIVATHNATDYNVTAEKFTDANGDATFNVTGDRVTFSISAWPGMEVHKNLLMDMNKFEMINNARWTGCDGNNSTECTTADWCALMQADTIPNWVWNMDIDESGQKPAASLVDTSGDGYISITELYTAALSVLDAQDGNNDGKLSFDELDVQEDLTKIDFFANVPVREYYMQFDPLDNYRDGEEGYYNECQQANTFQSTISVQYAGGDQDSKDINVDGSGWAYTTQSPDTNATVSLNVHTYQKDSDGTYSYLLEEKKHNFPDYKFYLLSGKTQAQMEANITVPATSFESANKNVTVISRVGNLNINTLYKDLYMNNSYKDNSDITLYHYYDHAGFIYYIDGSEYNSTANVNKSHHNYYGDGTLQESYNSDNYPMLDVDFTVNKDGSWTLSGSDMNKLNVVSFDYSANVYDNNTSKSSSLNVEVTWTVAPSKMPDVTLQNIVPSELVSAVNNVIGDNLQNDNFGLDAEEYKGQTETSLLNYYTGHDSQNNALLDYTLYNAGTRSVNYNGDNYNAGVASAVATQSSKKQQSHYKNPFTLNFNGLHVFSK